MASEFDAIVIGAGHNGLTAAGILAAAGRSVLVVERSDTAGGMMAQGTLDGVAIPRLAHLVYNLSPEVLRETGLSLDLKPLPTVALDPAGRHVLIDGAEVTFADGASHPDAGAYRELHARLVRYGTLLAHLGASAPPDLAGGSRLSEAGALARLGLRMRMMGKAEMREFLRIILSNAQDLILDTLPDGPLAGALAADAVRGAWAGPSSPGTVFSLIYRLARGGGGALPVGGMGALARSFADMAARQGVEIRTGVTAARILIDSGSVAGVELAGGERIGARMVLSTAGAAPTMALAGAAEFDIEAVRRLRHHRARGTAAKLNLMLDRVPDVPGLTRSQAAARLLIAPSVRDVERAFNPVKYGETSGAPIIELVVPTLTLPDPSGRHVLSAVVQYVPHAPEGGWTASSRAVVLGRIVDGLDSYMPGLKHSIAAAELLTPADIEAVTGAPGGHWHHGEMSFDQLLSVRPVNRMAHYAFGVPGLYLAGASAHPGGDITGLPGRNAARRALKEAAA